MLKRNKQHRKLNNKGMTLVELIVSVTVLVLVSGIILSAFVASMRASAKSRSLHRATTVAQNVMEGVSLKSAEDLAFQFNYPVIKDSNGIDTYNFSVYGPTRFQYNPKESVGELYATTDASGNPIFAKVLPMTLAQYNALCTDKVANAAALAQGSSAYMGNLAGGKYDFMQSVDGKYYYYMRNIESDGSYYNAMITLDADVYRSTGSSSINANSEELISVPTIDSTFDAVEVMGNTYDSAAMSYLSVNTGEAVDQNELHRIINLNISNVYLGTGFNRTKIEVEYIYYCDLAGGGTSVHHTAKENYIFDNEGDEDIKQLRNIYLYYYPLYELTPAATTTDTIVVNNPDNMDVEMYIIKQENSSFSREQTRDYEQNYEVTFNVIEGTTNAVGNSHITLHTNWDENLYSIYSSIALPAINQVTLKRNGGYATEDTFAMTDLRNKQAKDRLFNVIVDIYSSEKAESLSDFQSTGISEWFNPDNHLITVTGSISE